MFDDLNIKTDLTWSYIVFSTVAMAALAVALLGMQQISKRTEAFFETNYARQTASQEMLSQELLPGITLRNLVLKPELTKPFELAPKSIAKFAGPQELATDGAGSAEKIAHSARLLEHHAV